MKILEKILYWGLTLTLLTPLVIGESLIFPFVSTKAYFFYILIDLLLISYLLLLSQKNVYPTKNKLFLFFIALTFLGFVLDLFGIGFKNSFWGNYERMVGIYTSIHLLVYLWLLVAIFDSKEKYYKLLNSSLVVSCLVFIYGLLQYFKIKFFGMIFPADDRIFATFGNAAFLAGFVLLFIFIAGYLLTKNQHKYWRYFYIISILGNVVILFLTATRGALVGFIVALFIMLVLFIIFYQNNKFRLISTGLLLLIIIFSLSIFLFKESSLIKNNLALRRISEISLEENTSASRLSLWKMSIKATTERPIFGYGQNNIRVPLDKYHDYKLVEDWFDSSHNKFFDELLAHGLIGLLAQVAFWGWLLWSVFKRRKEDIVGSIIIIGLVVAYITQAMFIFDSFVLSVSFVFILGFLWVINNKPEEKKILDKKLPLSITVPVGIILLIFFAWLYTNNISGAKNIALAYSMSNTDINKVTDIYQKTSDKLFANYDILAPTMGQTALQIFNNSQKYTDVQLKNYIDLMARVYDQAIKDSANYSNFYINMAKLYQLASNHPRLDYVDKSIELLNKSLATSPNRIDTYYALAQGYFIKDDIIKAEDTLNKALTFNARMDTTYYNLAQVQARKGDSQDAVFNINQASQAGYNFTMSSLEEFAKIFIAKDDWPAAIGVFSKMHDLYPDNLDVYYNMALAYSKNGQKKEAIEWANKILAKDPTRQEEVKQFINSL